MSLAIGTIELIQPTTVVSRPGDRLAPVVRDVLRRSMAPLWDNKQGLTDSAIEIMPDERPMPSCGFVFIAIQPFETIQGGDDAYELVGVGIKLAISIRTSSIPWDRSGLIAGVRSRYSSTQPKQVISWITSMAVRALQLNAKRILDIVNTAPEYTGQPPLLHELSLSLPNGITRPKEVTATHFSSSQQGSGTRESVGLLQEVTFDKGLWLHNLLTC